MDAELQALMGRNMVPQGFLTEDDATHGITGEMKADVGREALRSTVDACGLQRTFQHQTGAFTAASQETQILRRLQYVIRQEKDNSFSPQCTIKLNASKIWLVLRVSARFRGHFVDTIIPKWPKWQQLAAEELLPSIRKEDPNVTVESVLNKVQRVWKLFLSAEEVANTIKTPKKRKKRSDAGRKRARDNDEQSAESADGRGGDGEAAVAPQALNVAQLGVVANGPAIPAALRQG